MSTLPYTILSVLTQIAECTSTDCKKNWITKKKMAQTSPTSGDRSGRYSSLVD
jgi:hypothetical protein